jgi:hypothetical protein
MACLGGSSNVFKKALNAAEDMNLINNVNFILSVCGGIRTWSIRLRISSTELLDAASNSKTLKQNLHWDHYPG